MKPVSLREGEKSGYFLLLLPLTLLGPAGGTMYLRRTVQIHVRACWKNLTFPNYEFGKGQYAFYPMKISCFGEERIKFVRNAIFHKAGPLQIGWNASRPKKKFKSQTLLWRVLGNPSWRILLNMDNHSLHYRLRPIESVQFRFDVFAPHFREIATFTL